MFDVEKLAILATEYCLPVSEDKKIGIIGHAVATPLIQQLYKHIRARIHWDLLKDMKHGEIYADGELIYEKGEFAI